MEYLAIGFEPLQDFTWSIATTETDPQKVADLLKKCGGIYPTQILMINNDNVMCHWNLDKDYYDEV